MLELGTNVFYYDSVGKHLAVVVYSDKSVDKNDKEHEDTSLFVYDYATVINGVQVNKSSTLSYGYSALNTDNDLE